MAGGGSVSVGSGDKERPRPGERVSGPAPQTKRLGRCTLLSRLCTKRQSCKQATADCFGEQGYPATTLETVAERLGVSRVTLYRCCPSQEKSLGFECLSVLLPSFSAACGRLAGIRSVSWLATTIF